MEAGAGDDLSGAIAGVIVEDGEGHFFAIAWDELRRFRVPEAYVAAVSALVHGAEPVSIESDLRGFGGDEPAAGELRLLEESVAAATLRQGRLAARRSAAWVLLR
jgi:hypothetical protein